MNKKEEDKQRKRSPNFPYASVRECVQYVTKLHNQVRQSKVPILIAFDHMGLSRKSSSTDRIRASMSSYKLTTEEIVNKEKFIRLTDLSNRIVLDTREKERLAAYREAALNDPMIKKLWEKEWKRGLPNDDATVISVLQLEYGFQDEAAKRFANVLKDNYRFCELASHYELPTSEDELDNQPPSGEGNPILSDPKGKKYLPEETGDLMRYPIPLDNERYAYIHLPSAITENDAEFIPDFVNLLLKKLQKASTNEQKAEE
jgi:hypothetical protein